MEYCRSITWTLLRIQIQEAKYKVCIVLSREPKYFWKSLKMSWANSKFNWGTKTCSWRGIEVLCFCFYLAVSQWNVKKDGNCFVFNSKAERQVKVIAAVTRWGAQVDQERYIDIYALLCVYRIWMKMVKWNTTNHGRRTSKSHEKSWRVGVLILCVCFDRESWESFDDHAKNYRWYRKQIPSDDQVADGKKGNVHHVGQPSKLAPSNPTWQWTILRFLPDWSLFFCQVKVILGIVSGIFHGFFSPPIWHSTSFFASILRDVLLLQDQIIRGNLQEEQGKDANHQRHQDMGWRPDAGRAQRTGPTMDGWLAKCWNTKSSKSEKLEIWKLRNRNPHSLVIYLYIVV